MAKNQTSYDDEFRRNAVDLYISSSKPYTEVVATLGIVPSTLKAWQRKFLAGSGGENGAAGTGQAAATREELAALDPRPSRRTRPHQAPARHPKKGHSHTGADPAPRYELTDEMREHGCSIIELCGAYGLSRSGYHASKKRPSSARQLENDRIAEGVNSLHAEKSTSSSRMASPWP